MFVVVGGDWLLASGAPSVLKSTPAEAVESLETTVLLMRFTASESSKETPAPSQPATLLAMMLLVILTEYQFCGVVEKRDTSVPLTACKRKAPPLPASAAFPINRLALTTNPGPVPSLSPGTQSLSVTDPHSVATPLTVMVASGAAPITIRPPPLVGMVGLVL